MTLGLPSCCLSTRTTKVRPSTCTCGRVRLTAPSSPAHFTETYVHIYVYMYVYMCTRKVGPCTCCKTHCYRTCCKTHCYLKETHWLTATSSPANTRIRMYIWMYVYVYICTEKVGPCICTCQRAHCSFVTCQYTITYVSVSIRIHTYLYRYERKCTRNSKPLIFSSICIHIHVHVYVHT